MSDMLGRGGSVTVAGTVTTSDAASTATAAAVTTTTFGSASNLAAALNSAVTVTVTGMGSVGFYLTIPPAATVVFEATFDGSTWIATTMRGISTDGYTQSSTASGSFIGSVSTVRQFRVRVSVAGSGAAGSVLGVASPAVNTIEGIENGPPYDLPIAISIGRIQGVTGLRRVGRNADIDMTQETVCNHTTTGLAQYSVAAETWYVSSSSASDTFQLSVATLDGNYVESTRTVTLSGQTAVAVSGTCLRLVRMFNDSGTAAIGDIYIQRNSTVTGGVPTTESDRRGKISIGEEQSSTSQFTVPAGFTFYCEGYQASSSVAQTTLGLYARFFGKVFRIRSQTYVATTAQVPFASYTSFAEKTDIEFRASTTANNTGVCVEIYGQVRAN